MADKIDKCCSCLWYEKPAVKWTDALPIGNGRLGAMVFGGTRKERIQLNEETVWDGGPIDRNNLKALDALHIMRKCLFEGRYEEAGKVSADMMAVPLEIDSYQPLADVYLEYDCLTDGHAGDYRRELDLASAVVSEQYTICGVDYRKEIFASSPAQVIMMRISSAQPNKLNMSVCLSREEHVVVAVEASSLKAPDTLVLAGKCSGKGVGFRARVCVVHEGGRMESAEGNGNPKLVIVAADTVTLYIAGETDFRGKDPDETCINRINEAKTKDYALLRNEHTEEYGSYYNRVSINLSAGLDDSSTFDSLPTDKRLDLVRNMTDKSLVTSLLETWYNYLRYLLISSSRPGCMPPTLQGIWNDKMKAPWNSDFHPNINLQMNYWNAEACDLPECHMPLFDWLESLVENGSRTARIHYGARGWVLHHVSDIFGCTAPMDGPWGIWPFGGIWLCRHIFEHYLYTCDDGFLQRMFPVISGAVIFMLDFLVEAPAGTPVAGHLVTNPSHSPENRFRTEDGKVSWLTYAVTMDNEIIRDLFEMYLVLADKMNKKAADGLADDENELQSLVREALSRLLPVKISAKTGGIQEWVEDYDEVEPGHRHISHLYALHPGSQINRSTSELLEGARKTLERRLSSNYDGQGWSLGWIANLYARLNEGDKSFAALGAILAKHTLNNLFTEAHGNPQVSDAQGIAAAINEMLLQSHEGDIHILPALPFSWSKGYVRGLKARGNYSVDIEWEDSRLKMAVIRSDSDGICRVRVPSARIKEGAAAAIVSSKGAPVPHEKPKDGVISFKVQKGCSYICIIK